MDIKTKYHGIVEIEDKDIFHFQKGLPGFNEENFFILLPLDLESPFWILQSTETEELGFVTTNPFEFFPHYELDLSENDKSVLSLESEEDVTVLIILNIKDPFNQSTANLKAPIILNTKNNHAKQIILNDYHYETKQKMFPEMIKK